MIFFVLQLPFCTLLKSFVRVILPAIFVFNSKPLHWRDQHFIFIFKEIYCKWKFHTNKATTFRMSAPTESDKTKRRNKNLTVEQIQEDSITQVLLGHLNALFGGSCMYNSISVCSALNEKVYTFMFYFFFDVATILRIFLMLWGLIFHWILK